MEKIKPILPSKLGYKKRRPRFLIKEIEWKKFSEGIKEKLIKEKNVIIIEPLMNNKELALNILNNLDITSKQGQKNFLKVLDKADSVFKKIDSGFEKLDQGFEKFDKDLEKSMNNIGKDIGKIK